MHLSFASLTPGYPGTSGDCGHTPSLEADKSPANICQLPRRAEHLWRRVANIVPALIPQENPDEVPAEIPSPNDPHQATTATPYMFSASRDVSIHKSPALSQRRPRYCPGTQEPGIQMIGALVIITLFLEINVKDAQSKLYLSFKLLNISVVQNMYLGAAPWKGWQRGQKPPSWRFTKWKIWKCGAFSCIKAIKISFSVIFNEEIHALEGLLSQF